MMRRRAPAVVVAVMVMTGACGDGGDSAVPSSAPPPPGTSSPAAISSTTHGDPGAAGTTTAHDLMVTLESRPITGLPLSPAPDLPSVVGAVNALFEAHEATPFCAVFRTAPAPGEASDPGRVTECRDMTSLPQRTARIVEPDGLDAMWRVHEIVVGEVGAPQVERWFCALARPGDTERSCDVEPTAADLLVPTLFGPTIDADGVLTDRAPAAVAGAAATITPGGAEVVAGRPATCWLFETAADGSLTQCLDDGIGLLVLVEFRAPLSGAGITVWELVEIGPPDGTVFEPSGDLVEGIFFSDI